MLEWLEEIKAGDIVYVAYNAQENNLEKEKVWRLTATQIITGAVGKYEHRYRKKDGHLVGTCSGPHIVEATQEVRDQWEFNRLIWRLQERIRKARVADLPALREAAKALGMKGVD